MKKASKPVFKATSPKEDVETLVDLIKDNFLKEGICAENEISIGIQEQTDKQYFYNCDVMIIFPVGSRENFTAKSKGDFRITVTLNNNDYDLTKKKDFVDFLTALKSSLISNYKPPKRKCDERQRRVDQNPHRRPFRR